MADDPVNSSRKRDAARTKGAILRSAVTEFAANGPAGTRVDEVAIRAAVNKSLIYQYFGSKQELYAEVLTDVLNRATERLGVLAEGSVGISEGGTFQQNAEAFLGGHIRMLEEMPEYARLMAWENLEGGKTLARPQVRRAFLALLERLQGMLKSMEQRGVNVTEMDPKLLMLSVMALDHHFVLYRTVSLDVLRTADSEQATREAWIKFCARMFAGLAK